MPRTSSHFDPGEFGISANPDYINTSAPDSLQRRMEVTCGNTDGSCARWAVVQRVEKWMGELLRNGRLEG